MKPQVSVIMAAQNAGKFIEDAIDSILSQTFKDFELIIIDDASTDNTTDIVKRYQDKRIKLVRNTKNLGVAESRNIGIEKSIGQYIAIMDADDISSPTRLEAQTRFLSNNPQSLACGSWYKKLFEDGRAENIFTETSKIRLAFLSLIYCPFPNSSAMIRKSVFSKVGGYKREYEPAEDFDLWSRIGIESLTVIPKYLVTYRFHKNSLSKTKGGSAPIQIAMKNLQQYGITKSQDVVLLKYGSKNLFKKIKRLGMAIRLQHNFSKYNKLSIRMRLSLLPSLITFY